MKIKISWPGRRRIMAITNRAFVVGIYDDIVQVDRVVNSLHSAGFQDNQIALDSQGKGTQSVQQTLMNMGMPENEARSYEQALTAGRLIMVVRADERRDDVVSIMRRNGGNYVWYPGVEEPLDQVLPLREERLQFSKQMVVSGEVRIRRRVVIEEKMITVKVAREEVVVEHVSYADGDQAASEVDAGSKLTNLNPGESIRIPLREEQIFVEKRPIIKEEVVITKQMVQDVKHIVATVQKEVPRLERDGDIRVRTADGSTVTE
jgi:uncharacterized protein (TIGR02271 family)